MTNRGEYYNKYLLKTLNILHDLSYEMITIILARKIPHKIGLLMNNLWGLWEYEYSKDAVASDYADCKYILYYVVIKETSFNL